MPDYEPSAAPPETAPPAHSASPTSPPPPAADSTSAAASSRPDPATQSASPPRCSQDPPALRWHTLPAAQTARSLGPACPTSNPPSAWPRLAHGTCSTCPTESAEYRE